MRESTEQLADELLVMRCQDGEAGALAELVSRWQQRLWRQALRLTGREDAAWEAAQEGWVSIVRDLRRLDDPARFGAWAYRIVTRKAADWIRRKRRDREGRQELADEPAAGAAGGSPDDGPAARERDEDLHAALDRLPRHQRTILELHYVEGFGVAEIAAILSVPAGTVKSRLYSARNELRRIWEARRPNRVR